MSSEFGYFKTYDSNITTSGFVVQKQDVTQATSLTTPVTANASAGVITMYDGALAADASAEFVFNNSKITADSVIMLQISYNNAGTANGNPIARIEKDTLAAGVVNITMTNAGTGALDAPVDIHYLIL